MSLNSIPVDILKVIVSKLDCQSKCALKCVSKDLKKKVHISKNDIMRCLFADIIANVGNNYQFSTSKFLSNDMFSYSYMLNIFINYAVLFQKFQIYNGFTIITRIKTFDRHSVSSELLNELLEILGNQTPISLIDSNIKTYKINYFLNLMNELH